MSDWFDDDSLWETLAPFFFQRVRPEEMTAAEAEAFLELLGIEPGAAVIGMPCGTGRHTVELAARGFRVTGVDRTVSYLEAARERAAARSVEIELVRSDMREFRRPDSFDLAVNLFTSFGYFEDPADDVAMLRNIRDSLRPGGRLLIEMAGREPLVKIFQARTWDRIPGTDALLLEEHALGDGLGSIENHWIWISGAERREYRFRLRLYSGTELARTLRDAGFARVGLYGDLRGAPYDLNAKRLVAVATR